MTGTNDQADMKIRLERLEREVEEHSNELTDATRLIALQATKINEQNELLTEAARLVKVASEKLAVHEFKLELLRVALQGFVKKTDKAIDVISESLLPIVLERASKDMSQRRFGDAAHQSGGFHQGAPTTEAEAEKLLNDLFGALIGAAGAPVQDERKAIL